VIQKPDADIYEYGLELFHAETGVSYSTQSAKHIRQDRNSLQVDEKHGKIL
jgi:hypothetical protein